VAPSGSGEPGSIAAALKSEGSAFIGGAMVTNRERSV